MTGNPEVMFSRFQADSDDVVHKSAFGKSSSQVGTIQIYGRSNQLLFQVVNGSWRFSAADTPHLIIDLLPVREYWD